MSAVKELKQSRWEILCTSRTFKYNV